MKRKTISAAAVSRLLGKAGFERSVSSGTRVRGYSHQSRGYKCAKAFGGEEIRVHWIDDHHGNKERRITRLDEMAEALGEKYDVERDGEQLVITRKETP